MLYEIRWSNGYWKLFDTHRYTSVAKFGRRVDALDALRKAHA